MGHPMDNYWEDRRWDRDALWERRDRVEAMLTHVPLNKFLVGDLADLILLSDRSAPGDKAIALEKALTRLEVRGQALGYVLPCNSNYSEGARCGRALNHEGPHSQFEAIKARTPKKSDRRANARRLDDKRKARLTKQ